MFEMFKRQQSEPVVRYAEGSHLPRKEAKKILPDHDEVSLDADPRPEELPVAITQHDEDGWMTQAEHDERIMKQDGYQQDFEDEEAVGGAETPEEFERAEANERHYNSPESIEGQTLYDKQIAQEFGNEDAVEMIEAQFDQKADEYILSRSLEKNQDLDGRFTNHARGGNSKPIEKDYKGGERIAETLEV